MQVLYRPHPLPAEQIHPHSASPTARPGAWLLDATSFHREFCTLFAQLHTPEGPTGLRARATELWESSDADIRSYVSRLPTDLPEEWDAGFTEAHLAQWYRILMAPYLRSAPAVNDPHLLRRGLPELGWSTADARRAAAGRELRDLARSYGHEECAVAINLVLEAGLRGWLSQDDAEDLRLRLRSVDPQRFRDHQHLVGATEELWNLLGMLSGATPDHVLVLLAAR